MTAQSFVPGQIYMSNTVGHSTRVSRSWDKYISSSYVLLLSEDKKTPREALLLGQADAGRKKAAENGDRILPCDP